MFRDCAMARRKRDGAFELPIVVLRGPLSLCAGKADRVVFNRVVWVHALIQSQSEDKRLKRRAGLTKRLSGPIKLALIEVVTTHHRFDGAGCRVQSNESSLHFRSLIQGHLQSLLVGVHLQDSEEREIADLEEIGEDFLPSPGCVQIGQCRFIITELELCGSGLALPKPSRSEQLLATWGASNLRADRSRASRSPA